MSQRVEDLITEIETYRSQFESFCRKLNDEELARPVPNSTWIVKDFISHLATIDRTVSEWFRSIAETGGTPVDENQQPATGGSDQPRFDVDRWNDSQVAKRRERTVDEIFSEAADTRALIIERLRAFDDSTFDIEILFPGDSKRAPSKMNFGGYLQGWAKHDPMHTQDMLRALPGRENEPEIVAWREDPVVGPMVQNYGKTMNSDEASS